MIFLQHHIYCAQSKVKWGGGQWVGCMVQMGGGGGHAPQVPRSYATDTIVVVNAFVS